MPKRVAVLALMVLLTVLAAGCGEHNQQPAEEEITIAGINLGDSTADVRQILERTTLANPCIQMEAGLESRLHSGFMVTIWS